MPKTYKHEKVTYGAAGRRWSFNTSHYSYVTPRMPGGAATAHKIARIINGAVRRTKGDGIDGLARANMNTIFHNAAKACSRVVTSIGTFDH